jgi:hypothetical protein
VVLTWKGVDFVEMLGEGQTRGLGWYS